MNKRNIEAIYPLTPMQKGMVFHSLYDPDALTYNEAMTCVLRGKLDIPAFTQAWKTVINEYSILRTAFTWKKLDRMLQIVYKDLPVPLEILDWSDVPETTREQKVNEYIHRDRSRGFDLAKPPLLRLTLIRLSENTHQFIWLNHHALLDGWSVPIVILRVLSSYEAFVKGGDPGKQVLQPFSDYVKWLQAQDLSQAKEYWVNELAGFQEPVSIHFGNGNNYSSSDAHYNEIEIHLSEEETEVVNRFCRENQITQSTIIQAAWSLLLGKYNHVNDVVFGVTVSGRPAELVNVEYMVGLFINTLPLRVHLDPNIKVIDWLKGIQSKLIENRQYEFSPLYEIQEWCDIKAGTGLFESILIFENYPVEHALEEQKFSLRIENFRSFEQTNYPINIISSPGKRLPIKISFDCSVYRTTEIETVLYHLRNLILDLVNNSSELLIRISMIDAKEEYQLLNAWESLEMDESELKCVHELFEQVAEKYPHQIAISSSDSEITYEDLNILSNKLARTLQKQGVGIEDNVGICVEKSSLMIVALLGVLKAGAAYIPLDPNYPPERLAYMMNDGEVKLLITQDEIAKRLSPVDSELLLVDKDWSSIQLEDGMNLKTPVKPNNLAYIIYTSGSTGQPKGVMIEHYSLRNFIKNQIKNYDLSIHDRALQFMSFSFDAVGAEIYPTLCSGATLVISGNRYDLSSSSFLAFCEKEAITVVHLPTAYWHELTSDIERNQLIIPKQVRLVEIGGENASIERLFSWIEALDRSGIKHKSVFINSYGPTETTISALDYKVNCGDIQQTTKLPIGKPLRNVNIYILDQFLHPSPIGILGELYIRGYGVGRGYFKREELTSERFLDDLVIPGRRMYRTGDLVRYLPDGNVEFIGRKDNQVKIRGFRIEMDEVESAILAEKQVRTAVISAPVSPSGQKLVAYLIPHDKDNFDLEALQQNLRKRLPDYMMPSNFILLDELPKTPSGKIDLRRLPEPDQRMGAGAEMLLPRTPTEEVLVGVWQKLLGTHDIRVSDNFLSLGGHSLLITQLNSRIREIFELDIPLRELFDCPTLADLAMRIDGDRRGGIHLTAPVIASQPRDTNIPLSFAQQRLWFLEQLTPENLFYNIPVVLSFEGEINIDVLNWCIGEIIRRHEVLRTTFETIDNKPVQKVSEPPYFQISFDDISNIPVEDRFEEAMSLARNEVNIPFNLSKGPLLRAKLIKIGDDHHFFVFTIHHIVSDGWSIKIMIEELVQLYEYRRQSDTNIDASYILEPLKIQYADFAIWQRNWLQGDVLNRQIDYWKNKLFGRPAILNLPTDHPRKPVLSSSGATVSFTYSDLIRDEVIQLSRDNGVTVFITLLTAFQILLGRYSGQDDILVGTPVANRNFVELEKLLGFFVNTLVIRTDLSNSPSFRELLKQVRATTLDAYAHQDLPFELLVEALQPERNLSHTPIFQVAFSLQNLDFDTIQMPGLSVKPVDVGNETSKFDLTLVMTENNEGLSGSIEYSTELFDEATILRMIGHFRVLLEGIIKNPDEAITNYELLTDQEKQYILYDWNETEKQAPIDSCAHELFENWAINNPDSVALCFEGEEVTYHELNLKANQLGNYLRRHGVGPDVIVGISAERSPEMIVGILGVMKAGGAYLPLDPSYPADRISFMIEDSQIEFLLSQKSLEEILPRHNAKIIWLDENWAEIGNEWMGKPELDVSPHNLAYVIYTSGSTGKPKGTLLNHRGLSNLAYAQKQAFHIHQGSKILQFSPYSFDASVWEIFMALANGASLCIARQEVLSSGMELLKIIDEEKVTNVTLPPSVLKVLPYTDLPYLETIIAAGEACTPDIVKKWGKGRQFVNAYGPTETTVCASMYFCSEDDLKPPPIGKPIPNTKLYILDSSLQPTPIGVPGELHVSGVSLARGYHNRLELTEKKFIYNPFAPGEKLYKTGDLVKYRPDGNIEFLGRIDQQVKVRGFRIELGEIENTLNQHPSIRESVVVAQDDHRGEKRLVAYIVPEENGFVDSNVVKGHLRNTLPEYMVPTIIISLDEFPLTPSGKVDRQALPDPEESRSGLGSKYVAPRNKQERELTQICSELLGIKQVGVFDNFFELGGHSLLATQFISRVRDQFGIEIALRTLFENPTIAGLSEKIDELKQIMEKEDDQLNHLMDMIDELSEEEVLTLLAQRNVITERKNVE